MIDRRTFLKNAAGLGLATAAAVGASGVVTQQSEAAPAPMRPPGALPEDDFLSTCIRCMRCADACPNHCISATETAEGPRTAGTPQIHPRTQPCMLCSRIETDYLRCTEACPTGALRPIKKQFDDIRDKVQMGVARIDFNLCYSYNNYTCGTCYHACPLSGQALKIGLWERPSINEDACIGCGLCERACIRYPQAIRIEPVERTSSEEKAASREEDRR